MSECETENPWTIVRKQEKFDCPYFIARHDTVSFAEARSRIYNSIRMKADGVCILPIDSEGFTTLIGQYRYVVDRYTWELPGGGAPKGRPPLEVAKAELEEEAGLRAEHWLEIVQGAASVGISDEIQYGFVAWGIQPGQMKPEPEERLRLKRVPVGEAVDMALRGQIDHLIGTTLLLNLQVRLGRGGLPRDLARLIDK